MPELIPCPFCGGEGQMREECDYMMTAGEERWHVQCVECGADGPWEHSKKAAVYVWNRRNP